MLVASLASSGCGGGGGGEVPAESTGMAVQRGFFDARLKGAWRVLGEGRLVEVGDREIRQFQEARSICYPDRQALPAFLLEGYRYERRQAPDGQATVDLHAMEGAPSGYTLEAIPGIPEACRKAPPGDAATVFKTMWDMLDLDYGFFKERQVDWAARYATLRPRITEATDGDALQDLLVEALSGFHDEHVSLLRLQGDVPVFAFDGGGGPTLAALHAAFERQSEEPSFGAFEAQWRRGLQSAMAARLTGGGAGRVLNGAMAWGRLPGNVGYIELSRMEGFSDDANTASDLKLVREEMDRAVAALADTRALIFDVAVNDGGYDVVSAEVAGRFADRRRPAFTVRQHRGQGRPDQSWFVEPKGPRQYLKPVYLLTTDRTVSAGDSLALMMRALPHVAQVGQPTSGSISNKLVKSLPGEFIVSFSNERYIDPQGVLYEGRGVPPKVALQVFDPSDAASLRSGHGAAIDRLLGLIAGTP